MSKPPSARSLAVKQDILQILADDPTPETLNAALKHLAQWRVQLLENTVVAQGGKTISAGPFAGMIYDVPAKGVGRVPRLLGTYEKSLIPIITDIIAAAPPLIIDIGCADGFYAVGLARCLPDTTVWARDADPVAQEQATALATANHVTGHVKVGGKLTHADFDICRAQDTTIICDIDGGEDSLLDPNLAKGLRRANILVEVHEVSNPGLTEKIAARFDDTHHISVFNRDFSSDSLPAWMAALSDLDRLLALWEARDGATPWLWMQRKAT